MGLENLGYWSGVFFNSNSDLLRCLEKKMYEEDDM